MLRTLRTLGWPEKFYVLVLTKRAGNPGLGGHSPAREDGASGAGAWLSENSGEIRNQPEIERRRILRGIHLSIVFLKLVDISALNVILSLFLCMA